MRWLLLSVLLLFPPFVIASDYYREGPPGPQGEQGLQGSQGVMGIKGIPGSEASMENRLEARLGGNVQWYDWQYINLNSGYRYDVNHGGHTVDFFSVGFKIGRSYESRQVDKLRKEIQLLKRSLSSHRGPR